MKAYFLAVTCTLAACVAAAMAADGSSLQCNQCLGKNQETCQNPTSVDCGNSTCATISELCSLPDKDFATYYQSCLDLPAEACHTLMRLSVERHLKLRVTFDCCSDSNNCNNAPYKRQTENEPNGYRCPTCFQWDSDEPCHAGTTMMNCTVNELDCATFFGKLKFADNSERQLSFRGCIIKGGCESGFSSLYGTSAVGNYTLHCKDPQHIKDS